MRLGDSIKEIRAEHSLTQDDFAEKYHVTRQTVSNWENGKSIPDLEILVAISNDYNIPVDNMLKEDAGAVKKNDQQRRRGKRAVIVLVVVIAVSLCILLGMFLHFRKLTEINWKMSDSASEEVKSADSPLELREGYVHIVKDGPVALDVTANVDSGVISVRVLSEDGSVIYENKGIEIEDVQQIQLQTGDYCIQVGAEDFGDILLTYDYDILITN